MQSTITKEEMDEHLSAFSPIFGLSAPTNTLSGVTGDYGITNSNNISHHSRSISSESGSSSLGLPARSHPSLDAFTQRRNSPEGYNPARSPAQSRRFQPTAAREVPSYISNRTRRLPVQSEDEDDAEEEPLREDATEKEKIEYKRRQNTLAARRSRRRRLAQFRQLEDDVARLSREKEIWKERALMMERILSTNGLPCPNFER